MAIQFRTVMLAAISLGVGLPLSWSVGAAETGAAPKTGPNAPPAHQVKELHHVEGWFISVETDRNGRFSHCQMLNPYIVDGASVLLTLTLSRDKKALVIVVDPKVNRSPGAGVSDVAATREGRYAFDADADQTAPAAYAGTVMRLELASWEPFKRKFVSARRLRLAGPDRERTFSLYGASQAVAALETCARTGKLPPSASFPKPTLTPPGQNAPGQNAADQNAPGQNARDQQSTPASQAPSARRNQPSATGGPARETGSTASDAEAKAGGMNGAETTGSETTGSETNDVAPSEANAPERPPGWNRNRK